MAAGAAGSAVGAATPPAAGTAAGSVAAAAGAAAPAAGGGLRGRGVGARRGGGAPGAPLAHGRGAGARGPAVGGVVVDRRRGGGLRLGGDERRLGRARRGPWRRVAAAEARACGRAAGVVDLDGARGDDGGGGQARGRLGRRGGQAGRARRPPAPAPAAARAAAAAAAPPPAALAVVPSLASSSFLSSRSGPTGNTAASARFVARSCLRKAEQRSQARRWRRTGGETPAHQALGDLAELLADLLAGQLARLGGLGQRDAGAHEQRLDRRDGRLHRLGDLLVGERVDLAQQQRGALGLGQLLDVADELAERPRARGPCRPSSAPCSDRWTSIESTPIAVARRRWFSERLRAMR